MNFVEKPNLPNRASTVLIGEKYAGILIKPLENQGVSTVIVPNNPNVDPRLSGHVDLSALHTGGEGVILAPYLTDQQTFFVQLGLKPTVLCQAQGPLYPDDAALNLCMVGEHVFYHPRIHTDIVNLLTSGREYLLHAVRQGYSRCSVCIISDDALITADRGMAKAASAAGLDVLLITPGFVSLPGFSYGFLGGACFKIASDIIAFTGTLDRHPDQYRILSFLNVHGINPVYLTSDPVFDIGSAIPLIEQGR